jgi:hypothetical protein
MDERGIVPAFVINRVAVVVRYPEDRGIMFIKNAFWIVDGRGAFKLLISNCHALVESLTGRTTFLLQ